MVTVGVKGLDNLPTLHRRPTKSLCIEFIRHSPCATLYNTQATKYSLDFRQHNSNIYSISCIGIQAVYYTANYLQFQKPQ